MLGKADTTIFQSLALAIESIWSHQNMGVMVLFHLGIYASNDLLRHIGTPGSTIMMGVLAFCFSLCRLGDSVCMKV